MRFGVSIFPTDYSMPPVELGRALEERGFESLFFAEHSHIPTSRESAYPGGGDLPKEYADTFDPFVTLGAIAAVTEHLRLGTGIALVVQRDPIHLAKQVSTLDQISGGRVLLGIGGGWNREEMRDHGTDPSRRWKLLRERVEAMKAMWTQHEAEYHGDFVEFGPTWQWPKPVQKPHPPIIVGGNGANTLKRVVRYGDAWMPIGSRVGEGLRARIEELQRLATEAGRDPIPVNIFGASDDPASIEQYASLGVERTVLRLPPAGAARVLPLLDRYARLIDAYAG
ncbi:MAG: TIGR03619 family F420-dependent LLM class oxidoreductase [Dehalococcoidia bacterium]|nr:TIGR03619 family F420-dependent LLM class oxidoreductase [Dehalococcoidia bacterium]